MYIQPIPRTVEEAVKVGPFQATDWLIIMMAILLPRMCPLFIRSLTVAGFLTWETLLQTFAIAGTVLFLRLKSGKPRGFFWYWFAYAVRPNRY